MIQQLEAVWQGGVLRPLQPLDWQENQKGSLTVQATADEELLDTEYIRYCEANADYSITLEEVRKALASIPGSMTGDFIEGRERR
jgi:predicted DNA-binding antitoxin AbrB/MazE fold protein